MDGFWEDFGTILRNPTSRKQTLMIRATRGRSTRPNHTSNQIDSPKPPGLANFGRVAGEFHSVAKQASFRVALRSDFEGFWSDFERFWEAKMDAKINFWDVFLNVFLDCVFASIFDSFFEVRNLKNSNFP